MSTIQNEHIINCDADPFIPQECSVYHHQKCGKIIFDLAKIEPHYLSITWKIIVELKTLKWIKRKKFPKILNACILDYLLAHEELIPDSWKDREVFFLGTIYSDSDGYLYYRYLYWREPGSYLYKDGWNWGLDRLYCLEPWWKRTGW